LLHGAIAFTGKAGCPKRQHYTNQDTNKSGQGTEKRQALFGSHKYALRMLYDRVDPLVHGAIVTPDPPPVIGVGTPKMDQIKQFRRSRKYA
jgi:hypothetical protein